VSEGGAFGPAVAFDTIQVELSESGAATVSLNRPAVRNAFNARMIAQLTEAFVALGQDDVVRAIVLKGTGRAFSAGADVQWMRSSLEFSERQNLEDARGMAAMFEAIEACPKPVIARVHGSALGGGMGLMAASDVVVAADDCRFGFTEVKLGIIPAVISSVVIPKIGPGWARALYLTGERFGASEAREMGLAHWVCGPGDLDQTVAGKVDEVLSAGPLAARAAKSFIREIGELSGAQIRASAVSRIASLRVTPEAQDGLRAFLEKRPPAWIKGTEATRGDGE
jgi:methylglutaconyl-CoA hydratase